MKCVVDKWISLGTQSPSWTTYIHILKSVTKCYGMIQSCVTMVQLFQDNKEWNDTIMRYYGAIILEQIEWNGSQ